MKTRYIAEEKYATAVLGNCVVDVDLTNADVTKMPSPLMGNVPKMQTGAIATVCQFQKDGKRWAARFFNRLEDGRLKRVREVCDYLAKKHFDFISPCEFIEQGVMVDNEFLPMVKMDWVDGVSLEHFLEDHCQDEAQLRALTDDFIRVTDALGKSGLAHGDLQHGNILVRNDGSIALVDYDGFFIPSLAGGQPFEYGHPHYTHPLRLQSDQYSATMDRFASWVIYLSLTLVREDFTLFLNRQDYGREDCLLFVDEDYNSPESSRFLKDLARHKSKEVCRAHDFLRLLLRCGIEGVPEFDPALFHGDSWTVQGFRKTSVLHSINTLKRSSQNRSSSSQKPPLMADLKSASPPQSSWIKPAPKAPLSFGHLIGSQSPRRLPKAKPALSNSLRRRPHLTK